MNINCAVVVPEGKLLIPAISNMGGLGSAVRRHRLCTDSGDRNSRMPPTEKNGFIATLNNMGYMTSALDPISTKFVVYSGTCNAPVLDVGAAYGVASLAALANGAKVIANDIEPRHIEMLQTKCPPALRGNLSLLEGSFTGNLDIEPMSLG